MLFFFSVNNLNNIYKPVENILINDRKNFSLEKIIKINPFYFFNNNIFLLKSININNILFLNNKYYMKHFFFFKLRRNLLFLKKYYFYSYWLKRLKFFVKKNSWTNFNKKKNYSNLDIKWISMKFFYWFLNYYKLFLILLIKIYSNLWIFFVYSFHILSINFYFKQYNFLYYSKIFKYKKNSFFIFKLFFKYQQKFFLYLKYNKYNFIQNSLNVNNLNLNIRLDSLKYLPKYINPLNFKNLYKRYLKRLKFKEYKKSEQYYEKKKLDRVWQIWKKFGKGDWRKFDNWNPRDKNIIKYIKDHPLPNRFNHLKLYRRLNKSKKIYNLSSVNF